MKLFLDTNIWLRYFLRDNEKQALLINKILISIEEGRIKPYISPVVILEFVYVLEKLYKIPRDIIIEHVDAILSTRNIAIIETIRFHESWDLYKKTHQAFSDCLILHHLSQGMLLCSFDEKLIKLAGDKGISPHQVISNL
ncbi:MAG: PIN domain-containing protein [Patescibacteria group bacterium]|nr:PIN domain-containing protein [Patescibacteria group bacterium]